jgi:hypothetical protein
MPLGEVIQLTFERFGAFQLLWSFYITVVIGIIAYVSAASEKSSPLLVRVLVATGFLMFAFVNLYALDRVREQRDLLADNARDIVARAYSTELHQDQTIEKARWLLIIDSNRPPQRDQLFSFHIACSGLVVFIIWTVPGLLVSMKRIFSLDSSSVAAPKSNYPTATVSWDQQKRVWRLEGEYRVNVSGFDFCIPSGFTFDLASIPRMLWWLIAPFELSVTAPLVHDFLYARGDKHYKGSVSAPKYTQGAITRKDADNLFLEIMQGEGVVWLRRTLAYIAVRLFGVLNWKDS